MKVIDLLNKIANEEKPKKFKWNNTIYVKKNGIYYNENFTRVQSNFYLNELNNEVEIIEEDKEIEEINTEWFKQVDMFDRKSVELAIEGIAKQLNETIKAVNELKKGK